MLGIQIASINYKNIAKEIPMNSSKTHIILVFSITIFVCGFLSCQNQESDQKRFQESSQARNHGNIKELPYQGSLNPYPTKSMLVYSTLKNYGMVNSPTSYLRSFYLLHGPLTKPGILVQEAAEEIMNGETTMDTIFNIVDWIRLNMPNQDCNNHRDAIPAEAILARECVSGCTDMAVLFVTIARYKGISASVTETVSEQWIAEMVWSQSWNPAARGHFLSEVYLPEEEKWVVVDPGPQAIIERDIKGYYLLNNVKYLFFERGLDPADYRLPTDNDFRESVKNRFYIEGNQP